MKLKLNQGKWLSVCALMVLSGCSTLSSLNPFSKDPLAPTPLKSFQKGMTVRENWSVNVGESEQGAFEPVVVGQTVFAASAEGEVLAIDLVRGKVRWHTKIAGGLKSGVAAIAGTVAVVDSQNRLIALDEDGKQKWKVSLGDDVTSVPVAAAGHVFVRAIDYSVAAYAADNGGLRWKFKRSLPALTLRENTPVHVSNGRVFAGLPGGRVVGLDPAKGELVWEGMLASPAGTTEIERISDITGAPVYNFREVCAASFQGRLGCLDASTGKVVWTQPFSSPNGASVDDRYVIANKESGELFAFSRNAGTQVWRINTLERRKPTVGVPLGRAVVIGDVEGYVHFINRDTGETLMRTRVDSEPFAGRPVLVDDRGVLFQSRGGDLAFLAVE